MESGTAEGPAVSSAAATGAQWLATLIRTRQQLSPKRLRAPGPTAAQLDTYFTAAAAAPDHGQITPWRFILVPDCARERLAEAFAAALRERDPAAAAEDLEDARAKAHRAPCLALAVCRIGEDGHEDIPLLERVVSLGAALQNLLLSAHADRFGCALVAGQSLQSESLRRLFALAPNEVAVCFVAIGTVDQGKPIRERPVPAAFVSVLGSIDCASRSGSEHRNDVAPSD